MQQAIAAIVDERQTHALALDGLVATVREAALRHQAGDVAGAHASIAKALDLASELLGECDAFEPLAALLGYSL